MAKEVLNIRESQFILMYGPGSIIEGQNGSRLIPQINQGLRNRYNEDFLNSCEIEDVRMSSILKDIENEEDIHLYRPPSNASLNISDSKGIYGTSIFPTWKICDNKKEHEHPILFNSQYTNNKCPVCNKESDINVRFVCACPEGHLDEVNWNYAVHLNPDFSVTQCQPKYYYWKAKSGSLSKIEIVCPDCNSKVNMNDVYSMNFKCSGRTPEKENVYYRKDEDIHFSKVNRKNETCSSSMKVIQKQSTSLRIANTLTLLKIPQLNKDFIKLLQNPKYNSVIKATLDFFEQGDDFIKHLVNTNSLPSGVINKIEDFINQMGFEEFKLFFNEKIKTNLNFTSALNDEFQILRGNEINHPNFSKSDFMDYSINLFNKEFPLKVCAVDKLKTVTTQFSYQRKPYIKRDSEGNELKSNSISSGYTNIHGVWYPAFEGNGEGIFITSDLNPIDFFELKDIADKWNKNMPDLSNELREDTIKNPLFVWWHTLTHAIIKSLSISCGYSSPSLHERIYFDGVNAGILIYNTSPGEDSGLGGLVETAKSFDFVLKNTLNTLMFCSNDPLCLSANIEKGGVNGAACHQCLLISETSCEHRNTLLDRNFFIK